MGGSDCEKRNPSLLLASLRIVLSWLECLVLECLAHFTGMHLSPLAAGTKKNGRRNASNTRKEPEWAT